jgi:hypothetical protein
MAPKQKFRNQRISFKPEDDNALKSLQRIMETRLNLTKVSKTSAINHAIQLALKQYEPNQVA